MKTRKQSSAIQQEGPMSRGLHPAPSPYPGIYGDGRHDDTAGIQAALDGGVGTVHLPPPPAHYLISKTLLIHSNQSFVMDRFSEIRLAPGSDCLMIANDDPKNGNTNISLSGGIWNMNGEMQSPNPVWTVYQAGGIEKQAYDPGRYWGILCRFVNVTHFTMSSLTLRHPVCFGVQGSRLHYFTFENIVFDYGPPANCMDGIHLEGECRFGRISNLQGATYDDMVALNADDGVAFSSCHGPIEDIQIDGLFAHNGCRAVRLLSTGSPVRRIRISNVFGTYHHNVVLVSRFFHERGTRGVFDHINIDHIYASKSVDYPRQISSPDPDSLSHACVYVEQGVDVGSISMREIHRDEQECAPPCVYVARDASIGSLAAQTLTCTNRTEKPIDMVVNDGKIGRLTIRDAYAKSKNSRGRLIVNDGIIGQEQVENINLQDDLEGRPIAVLERSRMPAAVLKRLRLITGENQRLFLDDLAKGCARINCGSVRTYTDTQGNRWLPDQEYLDGAYGAIDALWVDRGDIAVNDTLAPELYQTEAYGNHVVYKIPLPNGIYRVRLHFAETFVNNKAPGARLISVKVNERSVPQKVDPLVLAGAFATPYILELNDVLVEKAMIMIELTDSVEINGIEVYDKGNGHV